MNILAAPKDIQMCSKCLMDTSDQNIVFNSEGVCNYCEEVEALFATSKMGEEESAQRLNGIIEKIKEYGRDKEYDSLLGISGGVDSSYVAYLAKQYELRPLVIHFDNGWDSELAVSNISKLVEILNLDLQTYVIDWEEFRDLQRSFLLASVIDIELLTDHAILASILKIAKEHDIRYILTGVNRATESGMPPTWTWFKGDLKNIKAIQKIFGTKKIKSFPTCSFLKWTLVRYFSSDYEFVHLLDYVNYKKKDAMLVMKDKIGWQYYGGKHYESLFTKFYQAYILPKKFGVDKRKVHLSALIRNGELSREQALEEMEKPLYDEETLKSDREYVLKKLGFTEEEFHQIMVQPPRPHNFYPSDIFIVNSLIRLKSKSRKMFNF